MNEITAIITAWNRPHTLEKQINAIKNQNIPPKEIWIFHNGEGKPLPEVKDKDIKIISCSHNFKFLGRFAMAMMVKTEYVAIFDDDTIPGNRWFDNCLSTMNNVADGIMGTTGVVLKHKDRYNPHLKIGWNGAALNQHTLVDLVGHAWFFRRKWLKYLWEEPIQNWDNGEDIQFSALCFKHGGVNTYVPRHPPNDHTVWGSNRTDGLAFGNDNMATCKNGNAAVHSKIRKSLVEHFYLKEGLKTSDERRK